MKENTGSNSPKNQSNSDWVCFNCSNLNYSFRRICNRCRSITRQQNHQNYLQMQYLQIYYQQPYIQNDKRKPMQGNSKNINVNLHVDLAKNNQMKQISRKQSCGNGDVESTERKNSDWSCYEGEKKFMSLLDNAWEGLYSCGDLSQYKNLSESDKTREEDQEQYDNQEVLHNFDLTFI